MVEGNTERIPLGVIGLGNWAREALAPTLKNLPSVEVVALAARSEATRGVAQDHFPSATMYADANDLLGDVRLEAVVIAAPSALHARLAEEALLADKHVFLEPPVGMTEAEVHRVLHLAEQRDKVFHADYELRYTPVVAAMQKALGEGAIGKLMMAQVELSSDWGGKGDLGHAADEGFFSWTGAWYLDLLDAFVGCQCSEAQVLGGYVRNGELMDHGWALLDFPGAVVGQFAFNLVSAHDLRIGIRLSGTEGEMEADLLTGRLRQRRAAESTVEGATHDALRPAYGFVGVRESVGAFVDAVRTGTPTQTGVDVCRRIHHAIERCQQATTRP